MAAAAGSAGVVCWSRAEKQHAPVRGGGTSVTSSTSGSGHASLKGSFDRLQGNRLLPQALTMPSLFRAKRNGRRTPGNAVSNFGKSEFHREISGSTRATTQVAEATTAGLRETIEDRAIIDGHSHSFEGIQSEEGAFPAGWDQNRCHGSCFTQRFVLLSVFCFRKSQHYPLLSQLFRYYSKSWIGKHNTRLFQLQQLGLWGPTTNHESVAPCIVWEFLFRSVPDLFLLMTELSLNALWMFERCFQEGLCQWWGLLEPNSHSFNLVFMSIVSGEMHMDCGSSLNFWAVARLMGFSMGSFLEFNRFESDK